MLIIIKGMSHKELEMEMGWDGWNVRAQSKLRSNQIQALLQFLHLAWFGLVCFRLAPFSARNGIGSLLTFDGGQGGRGS